MNDKSKDTTKARQDLKRLGIRSGLWLGQNKNGKCSKPQAAYSFTPKNRKKFCQFIKGVKLLDGFGFNFKNKVSDNDTNITGLKSHDLCKSIGLRSVIRIDHQELKKVIWYVLHNNPEIDTYRAKFKIEFPNKDMKEEFLGWFGKQIRQRHIDNDPGVNESSELFALACGPSQTPISVNSCVVNGVRNNITQIKANGEAFKNDQYIIATQVKQCFYLKDMAIRPLGWKVVEHVSHKKFLNGGVVVVEDDPHVIRVDNSSDLALSTSLNDLEIEALHIDDQSIDVDAPPDIIDVVDEDDDIIDGEYPIPYDLADSDNEDLVNLDIDDGVNVVYSSEEED
ncbi:hypothetical protein Tco_0620735 [Tanacetum coccineum]